MTTEERRRRRFSEPFRKEQVKLIESGKLSIIEVSRLYQVKAQNVRRWLEKYGKEKLPEMIMIQSSSEINRLKELEKENLKLKQVIGEQQVKLIYQEELLGFAKGLLGKDFEKK